jgi:hypothetical protein
MLDMAPMKTEAAATAMRAAADSPTVEASSPDARSKALYAFAIVLGVPLGLVAGVIIGLLSGLIMLC